MTKKIDARSVKIISLAPHESIKEISKVKATKGNDQPSDALLTVPGKDVSGVIGLHQNKKKKGILFFLVVFLEIRRSGSTVNKIKIKKRLRRLACAEPFRTGRRARQIPRSRRSASSAPNRWPRPGPIPSRGRPVKKKGTDRPVLQFQNGTNLGRIQFANPNQRKKELPIVQVSNYR